MCDFVEIKSFFAPAKGNSAVIALGVFDGVHAGHRAVLTTAAALAQQQNAAALALTFIPHPRQVLAPDSAPPLLISPARRMELLTAVPGIGGCGQINFSSRIAAWEPEEFFRHLLSLPQIKVKGICVGRNWLFGRRGSGNTIVLEKLCRQHNIAFAAVTEVEYENMTVSSTAIRNFLAQGNIAAAKGMLGRPPELYGTVVHGMGVAGKELAAPTANLELHYGIMPADGVYAGEVTVNGKLFRAVLNIGPAPTYGVSGRRIEIHLLDFGGDLYGREITVALNRRLRDIRKFNSPEDLKKQIAADIAAARRGDQEV